MSVDSALHLHPTARRRSIHKDESPRSGLRPCHTLQGSRSHSDYGLVSHVQRLEEQRKLSDYGLLPPVVLPCVPVPSISLLSSRSASPKPRSRRSSWKNRFRWGFSAPNMRSTPSEVESLVLPSTSSLRNDDGVVEGNGACIPKSKSISFCVPTTKEKLPRSERSGSSVSDFLDLPLRLSYLCPLS
ncbi:hypothetical protein V3C99_017562 [Haemonchus contortus]